MAAPNQSQSPTTAGQPRAPSVYVPPRTPEEVAREQKRVSLLLEINGLLLQHIAQLQGEGMGGMVTAPQPTSDQANMPKMASQEYITCLRCMQANITWLAASASPATGSARSFSGPALMDSPIDSATLVQKYEELKRLFPNWRGTMNARPPAQGSQPPAQGQQQPQPHPQPEMQQNSLGPSGRISGAPPA